MATVVRAVLLLLFLVIVDGETDNDRLVFATPTPCGDVGDMCMCSFHVADCSGNTVVPKDSNIIVPLLTFIPRFPNTITALNFSDNWLTKIEADDFFQNVTNFTSLDLSFNFLEHINPKAFQVMHRLKNLRLQYSQTSYSQLTAILELQTFESLDLSWTTILLVQPVPDDMFYEFPLPKLKCLILDWCQLNQANMSIFRPLTNLEYLSFQNADASDLLPDYLPKLQTLTISENKLQILPRTCDDNGLSYYPSLYQLDLRENQIESLASSSSSSSAGANVCLPNLAILLLGSNKLRTADMTVLQTLRNLKMLDLSNSGVHTVRPEYLPHLRYLSLRDNPLAHLSSTCSVNGGSLFPRLRHLNLSRSNIDLSQENSHVFFQCLPGLRELDLTLTNLGTLNMTHFTALSSLKKLMVSSAGVNFIISASLVSLKELYLDHNELKGFPRLCELSASIVRPFYPQLVYLNLKNTNIPNLSVQLRTDVQPFPCLPNLQYLTLSSEHTSHPEDRPSVYTKWKPSTFRCVNVEMLNPPATVRMEQKIFFRPYAIALDIEYKVFGDLAFSVENRFRECSVPNSLMLIGKFSEVQTVLSKVTESSKHFQKIHIEGTPLNRLNKTEVQFLRSAVEITLTGNKITDVADGTFDGLQNLTILRLDDNSISSITENTFDPDTRSRLKVLNLSHNPFECSCSLLWFREWVLSDPALFDYGNPYSRYECKNIPGTDLALFVVNPQSCLLSYSESVLVIAAVALFICVLSFSTLFYRYRWRIRLVLYEAFRGNPLAAWRLRRPEEFEFDLFVSYDSEDSHWVLTHLLPVLEDQMELRLCAHQRDFIPGKNITDNIVDCLEKSKRVLALFSPNFADSQWCQFELEMCLSHVVDGDDVMVIVMLAPVPARDMSGAMRALMKTTTYMEWADDPEAVPSFWRRMTLALADILPGVNQ